MSSQKYPLSTIPQSPLPDAPPAYESIEASLPGTGTGLHSTNSQSISAGSPPNVPPKNHKRSMSSSSATSLKTKRSWFQFSSSSASSSSSRTTNEVRGTVVGLIKDLVRDHIAGSPAALGILNSCSDACATHAISLSDILQEKSIESHSAVYWAIVKRPRETEGGRDPEAEDPDIVGALLAKAAPLREDTIAELRQACLATSDQAMFQRLRVLPQFSSVSGAEQVLLGAQAAQDDVVVESLPGNEGAFAVTMRVPQYHKRMMISKEVVLEFVARNRLWRFSFRITPENSWSGPPPGSWCISISLQEPSLPTWLDARLLLPHSNPMSEASKWDTSLSLKIKSKQMMEAPHSDIPATQVVVTLDGNAAFASLQYSGSSYISADGTLEVRLEAKLTKLDPL